MYAVECQRLRQTNLRASFALIALSKNQLTSILIGLFLPIFRSEKLTDVNTLKRIYVSYCRSSRPSLLSALVRGPRTLKV